MDSNINLVVTVTGQPSSSIRPIFEDLEHAHPEIRCLPLDFRDPSLDPSLVSSFMINIVSGSLLLLAGALYRALTKPDTRIEIERSRDKKLIIESKGKVLSEEAVIQAVRDFLDEDDKTRTPTADKKE